MSKVIRNVMIVLGLLCSMSLALATPAFAQTSEDVDIAGIGKDVEKADPDALLEALEDPIRDRDLPDGLSDAEYLAPEDITPELGLLADDDLEGALGSVAYTLTGDPRELGGDNIVASIQYAAFEADALGNNALEDFVKGAEGGLDDLPEGSEATVDTIDIEGEDAALITYSQSDTSGSAVVQYIAIPVGTVFVFTSLTIAGSDEIDPDDVRDVSEELILAAVTHLGENAADA